MFVDGGVAGTGARGFKEVGDECRIEGPHRDQLSRRAIDRISRPLLTVTWLANRQILGLPEDRRHGRIVPRNPVGRLIMPNGISITCRILDVSQSGAGIATQERPPIGTLVTLGKVQGRVVRHLEDGFAIEFTRLLHPDFLEDSVTGE